MLCVLLCSPLGEASPDPVLGDDKETGEAENDPSAPRQNFILGLLRVTTRRSVDLRSTQGAALSVPGKASAEPPSPPDVHRDGGRRPTQLQLAQGRHGTDVIVGARGRTRRWRHRRHRSRKFGARPAQASTRGHRQLHLHRGQSCGLGQVPGFAKVSSSILLERRPRPGGSAPGSPSCPLLLGRWLSRTPDPLETPSR